MNKFYTVLVVFVVSVFSINNATAQNLQRKSSVNASLGLSIVFNANLNYEYNLKNNSNLSLGLGSIAAMGATITHIDLTHFFLSGKNTNYLEYGYGIMYLKEGSDSSLIPNFRLGYRSVRSKNYFRLGVSISEGLYIGKGLYF